MQCNARLRLQIVALLLAHGARVSSCAENWKGCSWKCFICAGVLWFVDNIATITCKLEGEMPIHYACKRGHLYRSFILPMQSVRWPQCMCFQTLLISQMRYGHAKIVKMLLKPGTSKDQAWQRGLFDWLPRLSPAMIVVSSFTVHRGLERILMCLHRLEKQGSNICVLQEVLMQHCSVHQSITDDVRYSEYTTSPSPSRLTTLLPAGLGRSPMDLAKAGAE